MRRWILTVEDEAVYNDAENIKKKFRKAAQISNEDIVVVTLGMSVTLIETEDDQASRTARHICAPQEACIMPVMRARAIEAGPGRCRVLRRRLRCWHGLFRWASIGRCWGLRMKPTSSGSVAEQRRLSVGQGSDSSRLPASGNR